MEKPNLQLIEIPSQEKIVERRSFLGQINVFAIWFFVWNTIHQIAWDFIFAIIVCGALTTCTSENLPLIRSGRTLIAVCTSIVHTSIRMNGKAKKRWKAKYG
jgi:hypothetical protein